MESICTELALCGSKNGCARSDNVFFLISEVCDGTVSLCEQPLISLHLQTAAIDNSADYLILINILVAQLE